MTCTIFRFELRNIYTTWRPKRLNFGPDRRARHQTACTPYYGTVFRLAAVTNWSLATELLTSSNTPCIDDEALDWVVNYLLRVTSFAWTANEFTYLFRVTSSTTHSIVHNELGRVGRICERILNRKIQP